MVEEQEEGQEDKNKRIRPRERARGQKCVGRIAQTRTSEANGRNSKEMLVFPMGL
jgi:hypothetical protein